MFEHIMVATDFSRSAMWAANTARSLADKFGSKLTLLHAYDTHRTDAVTARDYLGVLRAERFGDDPNVELVATPHPQPDVAICGEAIARNVDLVVAGRHGEHRLAERLLGTVTERVVRHAPCSVWVADAAQTEPVVLTKHILVGAGVSQESEVAVDAAGALAKTFGAWVTLLHVYDIFPPLDVLREAYIEDVAHDFDTRLRDKLETLRKDRLSTLPSSGVVVRDKSTVTAICNYAGNEKADLVVLGTHGLTGLRRMLIGSVAEGVVRHAPCSVLVMRNRRR
jgi:nucleotide-binding universal stress UspA family protein